MKHADSESVLGFAIRRSVFELHGANAFLLTDRHDKIIDFYTLFTVQFALLYLLIANVQVYGVGNEITPS